MTETAIRPAVYELNLGGQLSRVRRLFLGQGVEGAPVMPCYI